MSVKISLDTNAIRDLIKSDPEFEIEIKRAVLQNIVDDVRSSYVKEALAEEIKNIIKVNYVKDLATIADDENMRKHIDASIKGLVQSVRAGYHSYTNQKSLTQETKNHIESHVRGMVEKVAEESLVKSKDIVNNIQEDWKKKAENRIESTLSTLDTEWKKEMANAIRQDVANHVNEAFKKSII